MSRTSVFGIVVALAFVAHAPTASAQPANPKLADELIAMVRASWAADAAKKPAEANKFLADDYTEFNGDAATRIEGKAIQQRLGEATAKDAGKILAAEMLNPKVQVYGDVAILSYNYLGYAIGKEGKVEPNRAKSTRVFAKLNGRWLMVHGNFAPDPMPH